jgi:hypothetical protein
MLLKPHQLTVLATAGCPAACGHCCMNSGPGRKEALRFEQIRSAVDQLRAIQPLRVVVFAGGEPTLLGDDLLEAFAYISSLGIITRMVTNAYWAVSPERARAKVVAFREAGLRELNISADDYHLPFIPFERVENAWHASKGVGFDAVVIAACSGPKSRVTPEYVMKRLGENLPMRWDENGRPTYEFDASPDGTFYGISNALLGMLARAHDTLTFDDLAYPDDQARLNVPCPWAARSPALSPGNHLVACCGFEVENNPVLDFGDLATTPASELVAKADDDVITNAIALFGPAFLKRFIQLHDPAIEFRPRYATICEICEHVVTRPEAVEVLRRHAGELAALVLEAREPREEDAAPEAGVLAGSAS